MSKITGIKPKPSYGLLEQRILTRREIELANKKDKSGSKPNKS